MWSRITTITALHAVHNVIEVYHDSTAQIVAENDKSPAPNDFKAGLLDFFSFKMTQM